MVFRFTRFSLFFSPSGNHGVIICDDCVTSDQVHRFAVCLLITETVIAQLLWPLLDVQGRIQDLIRGGAPDRDRPKTAILGPQFWCWGLIFGGQGGARAPGAPPGSAPDVCGTKMCHPHSIAIHVSLYADQLVE